MEHSSAITFFGSLLEICLIDLLLSGDNALVIALACRDLPRAMWRKVVWVGTGCAVVLRIALTSVAALVLRVPFLKLIGAVLLVAIAIRLLAQDSRDHEHEGEQRYDLWKALTTILVADTVMSLDNVLAVAAASRGSLTLLALGLALSVPILIFGSLMVIRLLDRYPLLILAGAGVLGWVAGDTAVSDPAIQPWVDSQSFGLAACAPLIGAVYVMVQGTLARRGAQAGRPLPVAAQPTLAPVLRFAPAQETVRPSAVSSAPGAARPVVPQAGRAGERTSGRRTDLIITAAVLVPLAGLILLVYFVAWTIRHH
jgi:YjbE family integral membrane protein